MSINANTDLFTKKLSLACEAMHIDLSKTQQIRLLAYLEHLQKWNKTYNLTAIRDPEQALTHPLFDSLSVVTPLREYCAQRAITQPKILDVGSGGGLPGIVIAIVMTDAVVTCVDAVEKKIAFIRNAAGVLKLKKLNAQHARVEVLAAEDADIVISRAFASLKDFADIAGKHVEAQGVLVAMKGKIPTQEIQDLVHQQRWDVTKTQILDVPELDAERCLIWMKRMQSEYR